MVTRTYTIGDKPLFLRYALRANALFSLLSALLFILASAQVANFLGIHESSIFGVMDGVTFILIIGVGLLLFAAQVAYVSFQQRLLPRDGYIIIAQDIAWVAVSALILITDALPLTTAGRWGVLMVADIVAIFAILQYIGIRRMSK